MQILRALDRRVRRRLIVLSFLGYLIIHFIDKVLVAYMTLMILVVRTRRNLDVYGLWIVGLEGSEFSYLFFRAKTTRFYSHLLL